MENNKLKNDFVYRQYGFSLRFVEDKDAEFIVKLRTNPKTANFLHTTDNDVDKQIQWIQQYKIRESEGKDYYFIVEKDKVGLGVVRLYGIHENVFTLGSWTMIDNAPLDAIIASCLMAREIAFEILNLDYEDSYDGVNINNKQVLKYNLSFGMKEGKHYTNELGEFISLSLTKEDFLKAKKRLIKLLESQQ